NYITKKNKLNSKEKIVLKKYCKHCKKHTEHKETEKLD
ncbi:50S ribosomal protein L33, partial [Patescibacteria group bacterium]|nr:50S ribosomal protein L33 [Patescibacteria group bacterium]